MTHQRIVVKKTSLFNVLANFVRIIAQVVSLDMEINLNFHCHWFQKLQQGQGKNVPRATMSIPRIMAPAITGMEDAMGSKQ